MQVHSALLISTTCQRLGLGFYIFCFLASKFMGVDLPMNIIAIISLLLLGIGGLASAFHLGRPARILNTFANFQSHLTQEAIVTPFLGLALLVCALDGFFYDLGNISVFMQWISLILSLLFLVSTGLVYQLSARPAWNTGLVLMVFLLTAAQIGSLATMLAGLYFVGSVSTSLLVVTIIMFILCIIVQYLFIERLKTVGYGVNVNITAAPYRAGFVTWFIFGVLAIAVCLVIVSIGGGLVFTTISVISSLIGIVVWTMLFYKVALQVKMFPMYKVDLNVYF